MISLSTDSQRGSRKFPAFVAALLMLSGTGCANLTLLNIKSEKIPTADAEHPAIEVLAIWQAAEGPGVKGIPTRGFAGQIFFFTQDRATPVAVDGTARVYIFDDHGTPQDQARPLHQFDFDRESWKGHLQMPKIGPTYGVFIPYPRDDFHQAVCSLRVRFTPTKGRPLYTASSTIVLPGPVTKPGTETAQVTPLSMLAKKLQTQSQSARPWQDPSVATQPLNRDPQAAAAQQTAQASLTPYSSGASSQMQNAQIQYSQAANGPGTYSTAQAPQGARVNPIMQTAGTMTPAVGAPTGSPNSPGNGVDFPEMRPPDAVQPSGRIKLQAATPIPTNSDWSSGNEGPGSTDDERSAVGSTGPPISHVNHPLAD
jgi:hypothetical protein